MIKVAHVRWAEPTGGVESFLRDLCKFYTKTTFEMRFFFICRPGPYFDEMRELGCQVVLIPAHSGYDIFMRIKLMHALRDFGPDVVMDHGGPPLMMTCAKFSTGVPVVSFEHGNIEVNRRKGKGWLNYINGIELKTIAHGLVVNSSANRKLVSVTHGISEDKIQIIYLGIAINKLNASICPKDTDNLTIGYVGRISDNDKGTDRLPKLAQLLNLKLLTPFIFEIIGDGPDLDSLKKSVADYALSHQFVFHGRKNDVVTLLQNIDIVLIPSRTEAFGLVAIEALAAGCRVVAFEVGGLPEVLTDCTSSIMVPDGNLEAMANAVITFWRNHGKSRSQDGPIFVNRKFNIKKTVEAIEDYCKKILAQNSITK